MNILEINNLQVQYKSKKGVVDLVKDVSFQVQKGECLCILGESGSGKTMTMKALAGLLDNNFILTGSCQLAGRELLSETAENLRQIRGTQLTMILQNPMTCFDSLYQIGYQMAETFAAHQPWSPEEIQQKSLAALEKMRINAPEEVLKKYPHQLSGGMLQRIMIAIALTLEPDILIADEPTTAIDAITQFEIMAEFAKLKEKHTTMVFITHDLGVASVIADQVIVMNKGQIVDRGRFAHIIKNPQDPYTKMLVEQRLKVMAAYKNVLVGEKSA